MALAWKAGWVNALRGSNPLSSATLTSGNAGTGSSSPTRRLVFWSRSSAHVALLVPQLRERVDRQVTGLRCEQLRMRFRSVPQVV